MTRPQKPPIGHAERVRQLAQTRRRILSGPAEQAMSIILDHPQPAALVHSFSEQDLHFLIHDIGIAEAGSLIALASNRQWEYMLDMEVWRKDRMDFARSTEWLGILLQADPDRLVRWCFDEKIEFVEYFLFRNIELRIREHDQSPSDFGEGFFTDDDVFYVRFVDYPVTTPGEKAVKERRNKMLLELLRRLSIYDHPRYQGLLLEAMGTIPAETEEELYRFRNVRLGEKGFLPFDEAIGVYQPLQPEELEGRKKKSIHPAAEVDDSFPVPQFTASFLEGDNLFIRAIKKLSGDHGIQHLQAELAGLCNQVISADQIIIQNRDQLQEVVSKVSGYLSIGLARLIPDQTENRETEASRLLQLHMLSDLFRTGFADALSLKWKAVRWHKESWCKAQQLELTFWDQSFFGLLGGLLIKTPKFYDPQRPESHYREFHTLEEISATHGQLEQIMALDRLLGDMDIIVSPTAGQRLITYKNLLLTLWARYRLKLPSENEQMGTLSISRSAFGKFYAELWTDGKDHRIIGDDKKNDFLMWAAEASKTDHGQLSDRLGTVFEALFDEIERELATVRAGNLDPRFVSLFLLKP